MQRLVGLFVVWQLIFLVAANVLFLLWPAVPQPYGNATGQWQGWSLYAPDVPKRAGFVAVELRWKDRPAVKLRSDNEPDDLLHFFRPPGTGRLLNYEAHLRLVLLTWTPQDAAAEPEVWRKEVADAVRRWGRPMQAYLGWRRDRYLRDHPGTPPPDELILWVRLYEIGPPGQTPWTWPGPTEVPLVRWRPGAPLREGYLPVEMYDVTVWPYDAARPAFLPVQGEP
jgi:hypothetical protein